MKIGVVSDTHDCDESVTEALRLLRERGVELVLHCGDVESPETVRHFAGVPTHFVFGNCDKDRAGLRAAAGAIGATFHDEYGALELAGKLVGWVHGDDRRLLWQLETGGAFDYLFYGHTHVREEHHTGKTRVVNPGALYRAKPRTCIVLDLASGELEWLEVPTAGAR